MFASRALAARIEACEARLTISVVENARTIDPGRALLPIAGGVSAFVRPGSINKVIGVGFDGAPDHDALAAVEAAWWAHGAAVRFETSTLADPDVFAALAARGYQLHEFENVLGLPLPWAGASERVPGVEVMLVTEAEADVWYETMLTGFAVPDGSDTAKPMPRDELAGVFDDFLRTPGCARYLATLDGVMAGAGSVRFDDGFAQLCGATTVPAARRRGVQRALLAKRLDDAARAGCALAIVTTSPGSQSQANVMRLGFALLYARAVLLRGPAAPAA